jgi:hypothetical protein
LERIGIGLGGDLPIKKLIELGKEAESEGFECIWIPEDYYYRDAISRLTMLGLNTKTVQIAAGVINPQNRSPPLIAMTLGTLDEIAPGRIILGIGSVFVSPPFRWGKRRDIVFTCSLSDFFIRDADAWRPRAWEVRLVGVSDIATKQRLVKAYSPVALIVDEVLERALCLLREGKPREAVEHLELRKNL